MERDAHYYEEKAEEFSLAGDAEGVAAALYQAAVHDKYLRSQRQHYSGYLFALHYLEEIGAEDLRAAHLAYGELYSEEEALPAASNYQHKRIRIGFLAPRFVESSVMRFAEPLLLGLDREQFEVFAFAIEEEEDSFTSYLKEQLDTQGEHYFCLYGQSLEEGAWAIRNQEIDILFDLGGHSEGGQTLMLMAKKPAPIQLSGLGYFDTLGLPEGMVDGLLADEVLVPGGEEAQFTEPIFRLPQAVAFQPTEAMRNFREGLLARRAQRPVTFGVVQNVLKVTDGALRAWGRILQELPDSRLIIKDVLPQSERLERLRRRAEDLGLPMERVKLQGGSLSYWQIYEEIDIVLDTFPYPGGFMTALALYFGVPVITLRGCSYGARFGASILKAAGREEWIAGSVEEYVGKALELGGDAVKLRQEQERLFEEIVDSSLLDVSTYVRKLADELSYLHRLRGRWQP
ncbi:hypothetical protein [Selenomonas sp. KH1T6]|uniref:O-linked N-acetylglucosamine transferase, SPINDLY family protein n=1 Tax=Selenomonas sp. KH1T6 TaxID=3158784 RepID=UPI0008A7C699|nr:Glycosyl transferase family 41 [Selenomonas ruminantium]